MRAGIYARVGKARKRGAEVTKNEIIAKTLKEIGPRLEEHEEPYSEEPDCEEIVIAELQGKLPDTDIKRTPRVEAELSRGHSAQADFRRARGRAGYSPFGS
jgi:hypothetical protein